MKIPRKFEGYQPDVYPPTFAGIPSMSNEDWRCGQNSNPMLMSLEPGNPVLSKTEFKTWEIDSAPKTTMGVSPSPYSPRPSSPEPTEKANSRSSPSFNCIVFCNPSCLILQKHIVKQLCLNTKLS